MDKLLKQRESVEPKQDNLFVRYMKQAMSGFKKTSEENKGADAEVAVSQVKPGEIDRKAVYKLKEVNFKKNFIVASCCNPLPGDEVFGFITDKNEVEVHKRSCETGIKLKSRFGERIVATEWGDYKQYSFLSSIVFSGIDRIGILNTILSKLAEEIVVNIKSVNVTSKDGIFEGVFNVHVHSVEDVNVLISKIAKVDGVTTVHRALI